MHIKANSISRFITYDLNTGLQSKSSEEVDEDVENCWRDILQYPYEGWGPRVRDGEKYGVLDPSLVLGRMLCNLIDVASKDVGGDRFGFSGKIHESLRDPISWLLRRTDYHWSSGQVLSLLGETDRRLQSIVEEIKAYWPNIFRDNDEKDELVVQLLTAQEEIDSSQFFHISAPFFHTNWEEVLEKSGEEGERTEHLSTAKQQWSMTVGTQMWKFVERHSKKDRVVGDHRIKSVALQSGGGHVLLSVDIPKEASREDVEGVMDDVLSNLREMWKNEQNWSPILKCSCDNRGEYIEKTCESVVDERANGSVLPKLLEEFGNHEDQRKSIRRRWGVLGVPGRSEDDDNTEECMLYLDVIELSDKCWPKEFGEHLIASGRNAKYDMEPKEKRTEIYESLFGENRLNETERKRVFEKVRKDYEIPRSKEETRMGFLRSRVLTSMIESTFGFIISRHIPSSIESMGGDEMTAKIRKQDILEVYTDIESHMQRFYTDHVIDPESEYGQTGNIWWMGMWDIDSPIPDLGSHKDSFRTFQTDWGGNFVVPMWKEMTP